ncbi:MAG: YqgE/AlgH family protein [Bacteroidales bacterium]|nr:YqgE/AlgH family protein [Bacteroidales bacterium]
MFEIKFNSIKPLTGRILVAEPLLQDKYFHRTTVLLIEHNDEGSFGVILNKMLKGVQSDLFDALGIKLDIYFGGPVDPKSIFFIHRRPDIIRGGMNIGGSLYWGGNVNDFFDALEGGKLKENEYRFFMGYSGWGPGQLERELQENTWAVVIPPNLDQLLSIPPHDLWKRMIYHLGKDYLFWTFLPSDPQLN